MAWAREVVSTVKLSSTRHQGPGRSCGAVCEHGVCVFIYMSVFVYICACIYVCGMAGVRIDHGWPEQSSLECVERFLEQI